MIALDTNVVVRMFVRDDPDQAEQVRALLERLSPDSPGHIGLVVLVETHWVLARAYKISADVIIEAVEQLLATGDLVIDQPTAVREALQRTRRGADFADAVIDAVARQAGARQVVTFDRRAARQLGWALVGSRTPGVA